MNSIKYHLIFLIIFIIVVISAFIIPQYVHQQKEDAVQVNVDELTIGEDVLNTSANNSLNESSITNETLIKDELVTNIS